MSKPKIEIGTEVFFYSRQHGFFSDKIAMIEDTKAVFNNWPPMVNENEEPFCYIEKYKVAIVSLDKDAQKEKQVLVKYLPHGIVPNDDFSGSGAYFSLNKKAILEVCAAKLESKRNNFERRADEAREEFQRAVDNVGALEKEEARIKEMLANL